MSRRRSPGIFARTVVGLAAFALILECFARLVLSPEPVMKRLRGLDAAQRIGWTRTHRGDLGLQYAFDVYDSLRGWAIRPNLRDDAVWGHDTLTSDSRGVRAGHALPYEPAPGRHRVVVLGDSYSFGEEVSDGDTYAAQLQQRLPMTDVINLGVHGYGHDQMLLYLEEEGLKYRPDVVILGFVALDMLRNVSAFQSYAKPLFVERHDSLVLTHVPVPAPSELLHSDLWRPRFLDLLSLGYDLARFRSGVTTRYSERLTAAIFDSIISVSHARGARPVFVYMPVLRELTDADTTLDSNERFLADYCRRRNAECLFLRPRFTAAIAGGVVVDTARHWNAASHRVAAEAIATYLSRTPPWKPQADARRPPVPRRRGAIS